MSQDVLTKPTGSSHLALAMSVVCGGGGLLGMIRSGSARSLVAGTILAGGFGWAAHTINNDEPLRGYRFATAMSVILTGAMGSRFIKTRQLIPSGILAISGVGSTIYHYTMAINGSGSDEKNLSSRK